MRKNLAILLLLALMISGCGKKPAEETLPPETVRASEETGETVPEVEYAVAEVNGVPAVLAALSRGDTVDIVDVYDEAHYAVKLDTGYGLVEKNLVRMSVEPEYVPWTGYAYQDAALYGNYRLSGDPVKKLASNTEAEVLDDLGCCLLVSCDGTTGYMVPGSLGKTPADGNASGNKKGKPAAGKDGGSISMQHQGGIALLADIAPQQGEVSGKATVLADETQIVLGYFDRGDTIPVVTGGPAGGYYEVYLDGLYARVSAAYVRPEDGKAYEEWEGRTNAITSLYSDIWMLGSPSDRLNANTGVKVLYALEDCYLVQAGDVVGYAEKDRIEPAADTPVKETTPPAAKPTEPSKPTEETTAEDSATEETEIQPTESEPTVPETEPSDGTAEEDPKKETTGHQDPEWTPPML